MRSENLNELAAALSKAQGAMEAATYNRVNPHFKNRYADLAAIWDAIRGPLSSNGLAVTQVTEIRERGFVLVTTLHHASGQWLAGEYALPVGGRPQEVGSALTYARRYSLCGIVGIVADDDDDAEAANKIKASEPEPKRPNPHTNNPEDFSDHEINPAENIPHVDGVAPILVKDQRPLYDTKMKEMMAIRDPDQLFDWGKENATELHKLGPKWLRMFKNEFGERMEALKEAFPQTSEAAE
jgi:hypothetical protein